MKNRFLFALGLCFLLAQPAQANVLKKALLFPFKAVAWTAKTTAKVTKKVVIDNPLIMLELYEQTVYWNYWNKHR